MDSSRASTSGIGEVNKRRKVKVFNKSWLDIDLFKDWLTSHPDDKKAYCTACKTVLICGKTELSRHANRKSHIFNMTEKNKNNNADTFASHLTSTNINESHAEKVKEAEIKLAAFYAERNIAIQTIDHLIPLLKDICSDPQVVKDLSLSRTKCSKIIKNVIAKRENERTNENLKNNKFSILIDESTSITNDKMLCILVKYVAPETKKSITELLELLQLDARDCSADKIYSAFKSCLENKEIPLRNIIGMACDNASVMTGIHDSFYSRLKYEVPSLTLIKCICHSSALVASKASSKLPDSCEHLLHAVSTYISCSAKRSTILREYQQYFGVESRKILKLSGTRWLVLQKCVVRLLENWEVLKHYFYLEVFETKNKSAQEILDIFNDDSIKAYMLFLKYSLNFFNTFNAFFQSRKNLIHSLAEKSEMLIQQIGRHFLLPAVLNNISAEIIQTNNFVPLHNVNLGPECETFLMNKSFELIEKVKSKCLDFYIVAVEEMLKRLPYNDLVFRGLKFLQPDIALYDKGRNIIKNIEDIAIHFGTFDTAALALKWKVLPSKFSDADKTFLANLDIDDMWGKIFEQKRWNNQCPFPNLQQLVNATFSLPHSNAEAERIFSIVTDVKDKKRNRLNIETLNAICKVRSTFQALNIDCRSFKVDSKHLQLHNSQNLYASSNNIIFTL